MFQRQSGFLNSIPPVTKYIMMANVLLWLATLALPFELGKYLGLHFAVSDMFNPAQLVTYMFMHATYDASGGVYIFHIFFNMFALFMFGRVLETVWGQKRFLIFYLVTGIGAGIVQELAWLYDFREIVFNSNITSIISGEKIFSRNAYFDLHVTVGASGAVFGILLAFGMLFPNAPLLIMFFPVPIKAKYMVILYGVAELFMGVAGFSGDNVAHFAHLGGMLFGFFLIKYWQRKDRSNRNFNNNGWNFR
ncbi:MAG: rhomboid family intramembrane serine protease [Bacteroidales bacterium]|jgi:membrane associated rhomboid family serine protease|nr:rhomboid family intramembrane serine protease [Bacteroidales bacterium]